MLDGTSAQTSFLCLQEDIPHNALPPSQAYLYQKDKYALLVNLWSMLNYFSTPVRSNGLGVAYVAERLCYPVEGSNPNEVIGFFS
jgi:hypothetical protein